MGKGILPLTPIATIYSRVVGESHGVLRGGTNWGQIKKHD